RGDEGEGRRADRSGPGPAPLPRPRPVRDPGRCGRHSARVEGPALPAGGKAGRTMIAPASNLLDDPVQGWAAYEPSGKRPWDLECVAHLHRRAGFTASWGVLRRDLHDGPAASIDRLIRGEATALDGRPAREFEDLLDAMAAELSPSSDLTR